jgi:hypothetical protein
MQNRSGGKIKLGLISWLKGAVWRLQRAPAFDESATELPNHYGSVGETSADGVQTEVGLRNSSEWLSIHAH